MSSLPSAPNAARLDRSQLARLVLSGADARDFLHRMTSNDVESLKPGEGCATLMLERTGRFVDRLVACDLGAEWLLVGGPGRGEALRAALEKYVIAEDVAVAEAEGGLVTVLGDRAPEALRERLGADVSTLERFHHRTVDVQGESVRVVRAEDVGGRTFHVVFPESARGIVTEGLAALPVLDDDGWRTLRVAWGLPEFGEEFGERTIALEAGMRDAISFTKGCYIGQEVIARLHHHGRVKRALVRLRIEGGEPPASGAALAHDGAPTGEIRTAVRLEGSVFALASVRTEHAEPGTRLELAGTGTGVEVLPPTPAGEPA